MAKRLKDQYPIETAHKIAFMIKAVHPSFLDKAFVEQVQNGYNELELMDRAKHIAAALRFYLPKEYPQAVTILLASIKTPIELDKNNSIASFIFMPHTVFVADNGLGHFELSMHALYQLTQVFTAEFAIRPFIQAYPEQTLRLLTKWATDANEHVRRLVSEGTRTRLPWAARLGQFITDPQPVIGLLTLLKDDQSLYVRRSVANNLNDIGKDHPKLLTDTCRIWLKGADKNRLWLIKHALRSAVKRADKAALALLGFGHSAEVSLSNISITPAQPKLGEQVQIAFDLVNQANQSVNLLVDFTVHFVKANGQTKAKVFKLKTLHLAANEQESLSKKLSLKPMTTRTLYPGKHKIELLINGCTKPLGEFELVCEA